MMRSSTIKLAKRSRWANVAWCYCNITTLGRLSSFDAFMIPRSSATIVNYSPWNLDSSPRLYSSFGGNNNNNNDKEEGIVSQMADKIKSFVPFWKSKEEEAVIMERRQRQEDLTGGLDRMLKDAPLGMRLMGKMVAPILGSMSEAMAEQSRAMEDLLNEAQGYLTMDPQAAQQLGQPIQVSMPFSQSSSTMSINGQTTKNVQASFQVTGSYASGTATMIANESGITNLTLNVNGYDYYINLSNNPNNNNNYNNNWGDNTNYNNDGIIDAEFVEKKTY